MATRRSNITPCDAELPQVAREFVRAALDDRGLEDVLPQVDLLVSELATYAVVGGEFEHAWLETSLRGDELRVAVVDPVSLLSAVVAGLPLSHTLRAGGIGLLLVDNTAKRWGIAPAGDGTAVWMELDLVALRSPELQGTAS